MGRVNHYALAIGLIGALKSFMLTQSQYDAMLRIRDPYKVLMFLRETVYGQAISEVIDKTLNVENIEKALLIHYYGVFRKVLTATPTYVKPLLNAILGKHEATCLKMLIRLLAQNVDPEEAFKMIVPIGRYNADICKAILNTRDVSRIVDFLDDELKEALPPYFHTALFKKIGSIVPLEAAIDRYVMIRVWNEVQTLKGYDERMVKPLVGTEIDAMNIMVVLRIKNIGIKISNIADFIIPVYYRITNDALVKAYDAPSLSKAIDILMDNYYGKVISADIGRSLFEVEVSLKRYIAKESARVFQGDRFHAGILIGFLNLKFYEINDLITIINGKVRGIPEENIRKALILY